MYTLIHGSHTPLDIHSHWTWRNPLNVLPFAMVLITLVSMLGM